MAFRRTCIQNCIGNRVHTPARLITLLIGVASLLMTGCGVTESATASPTPTVSTPAQSEESRSIVLGNVDARNPSRKIEEFQPLADYLAANLASFGITEGRVIIAKDTAEMARLMTDAEVDLYLDAAVPTLEVCSFAGCEVALRQWKGEGPDLAGVFVTMTSSGISSIDDLRGRVIMLEQPHSTVGHILPLVTIAQHGITVEQVSDPQDAVADDEIGYFVSSGGQSSMNLLLNREIAALAIGERAFDEFSPEVQEQVVIFEQTIGAPSQLVSFRPGFHSDLRHETVKLLLELEHRDEGQELLKGLRDTKKFDELPAGMDAELLELYEAVKPITQGQ